jgi:AmmeMemoRadiSam system protein B
MVIQSRAREKAMQIRPASVAGTFYPADRAQLHQQVQALLHQSAPGRQQPAALIVPHAGYLYSGALAGAAYRELAGVRGRIRRVALFGPAHCVRLEGLAVPSVDAFATPLGDVPLDRSAIDGLLRLPDVSVSDEAHRDEHCLEVQLPFLQEALGDFSLVPVLVGCADADTVARVMDTVWQDSSTLLVVSTDMSHFLRYPKAQQIDLRTSHRVLQRRDDLVGEEACGARVLNGLSHSQRARSLALRLVGLCNSGDTGGDRERVVGYGAFVLQ